MSIEYDVAIVGGGIVGSVLAVDLAQQGFTVALVDKSTRKSRADQASRYFALSLGSCNYLNSIGLSDIIQNSGNPITSVEVIEQNLGDGISHEIIELDPFQIGASSFGCMIAEKDLYKVLNTKITKNKLLKVFSNVEIESLDRTVGYVTLYANGKPSFNSRIVAICDGRQSQLTSDTGFNYLTKDYEQSAISCTVKHEVPNSGVARQYFLPTGPLAFLPISSNEVCIVWTNPTQTTNLLKDLGVHEFHNRLQQYFHSPLGDFSITSERTAWPLSMAISNRLIKKRIILAGDAVRKIHPLAGQGLNLGLRDAAALVEVLTQACQRGEDIGFDMVLERYQRWRQFDSTAFTGITDRFNWIYLQSSFEFRFLRKFGVSLLNRIPTLKGILIKEAAGLAGDIPKAMQSDF